MKFEHKRLPTHEVVKVVDVDPIAVGPAKDFAEPFRFRIEILRNRATRRYHALLYRRETFLIKPSYPTSKADKQRLLFDQQILVVDRGMPWETIRGRTPDDVLQMVLALIEKTFHGVDQRGRRRAPDTGKRPMNRIGR